MKILKFFVSLVWKIRIRDPLLFDPWVRNLVWRKSGSGIWNKHPQDPQQRFIVCLFEFEPSDGFNLRWAVWIRFCVQFFWTTAQNFLFMNPGSRWYRTRYRILSPQDIRLGSSWKRSSVSVYSTVHYSPAKNFLKRTHTRQEHCWIHFGNLEPELKPCFLVSSDSTYLPVLNFWPHQPFVILFACAEFLQNQLDGQ